MNLNLYEGQQGKDPCHQIQPEFDPIDKWWKERTNSYKLFSVPHVRAISCMGISISRQCIGSKYKVVMLI